MDCKMNNKERRYDKSINVLIEWVLNDIVVLVIIVVMIIIV